VKKLSVILWLLLFSTIGRGVIDYLSSQTAAFEAYREQARAMAAERRHQPPYEEIEGRIVNISYRLLSVEHDARDQLRLSTVQSIHFQKGLRLANWEGRKIAQTRHDVVMRRTESGWEISRIQEYATTVSSFGSRWLME
jgi:hypothetical protein